MKPTIVITEALDPIAAQWLETQAKVIWSRFDQTDESDGKVLFNDVIEDADALIVRTYTQVDEALLKRGKKLKVIGRAGVGLDNFDLPACQNAGIQVVYTPDANSLAVIDYVIGLMIDHIRPWSFMNEPLLRPDFHNVRKTCVGRQLSDLTLGIWGYGRIGKRLGKVADALGMHVLAHDLVEEEALRADRDALTGSYPIAFVNQTQLLNRSDVLSIHVDGRSENTSMVDMTILEQMKPSCLLINAARGNLVDDASLATWLKKSETISAGGAAILDVHDPEPPTDACPLWGLKNCKLLPHLASRTSTAMLNMSWVAKDVMRVLNGEKPQEPAF